MRLLQRSSRPINISRLWRVTPCGSKVGKMDIGGGPEVLKQLKDKALKRAGLTEETLQEQIEQRNVARKNKQFEISDGIRKNLATKGIALMDEPSGTVWRPCEPEGSEES
ncbi:Peptidase family M48 family protein [Zea mays]|uniref:Peptidase family M48 family protein n=1 Tax=Zea mays TaxID=4577 RepID=A0A1D6PY39_MAIZE|nr:Peptidase family M48 family protein [Zea mays]